ncbi:hypothetical protein [Pedobacter sp. Leaf170]|uniref:hypothetical protein n=1 Tax=Pedobacter sp. Leaf170 TaxID=2876558 RepID=UPI001E62CB25|nr:hypothetical protein [Pedobacter sp. Leaf170]
MSQDLKNFDGDGHHDFKDKKYSYSNQEAELVQVREYLTKYNHSATMIATALNIYRPNISRYVSMLREDGLVFTTHKGYCKETGRLVCYLSCNPELKKGGAADGE